MVPGGDVDSWDAEEMGRLFGECHTCSEYPPITRMEMLYENSRGN